MLYTGYVFNDTAHLNARSVLGMAIAASLARAGLVCPHAAEASD